MVYIISAALKNIFSWTRHEFLQNMISGWSVCWSVHLLDKLESRSPERVGHNWFWDVVHRRYLHQWQLAESSGLQLLVMHLCFWWVEQSLWKAFCLRCRSLGSRSHTLLTHFSRDFYGCFAVFRLDWLSSVFTLFRTAIRLKKLI